MKPLKHNNQLTHKDKILFPKTGITKEQIFSYYDKISEYILPYLKQRPLTIQRFPKGIESEGFFQKNAPNYFPDWIPTVKVKKGGGWVNHVICNTKETLLYLVNQDVITFHVALSTIDKIEYPDKLVFDLDPPKENFKSAIKAANALRFIMEKELELKTFVMTSGSKGLHLAIPLKQLEKFDEIHDFAKMTANYLVSKNSNEFTTAIRKEKRQNKLYIDWLRNSYGQTSVAPFSIRAIENAPVATVLYWNELEADLPNAQLYTINSIFKRLATKNNPWDGFEHHAKSITKAKEKLKRLMRNILFMV